jgi:cytochrome c peroxidase
MRIKGTPIIYLIASLMVIIAVYSCSKSDSEDTESILGNYLILPNSPYNYSNPDLPAFFDDFFVQVMDNTPSSNPVTDWGATLGRVLFYDKQMSINNKIACSSCHMQEFGFSDTAVLSSGFEGGKTGRHSMGLTNARYYVENRFFWDERAATLEDQVLMPIQDPVEMGMHLDTLVKRLESTEYYPILFNNAFGSNEISKDRISKALAQFVRSMVSYTSPFDEGRQLVTSVDSTFPNFTVAENRGKSVFFGRPKLNCAGCHTSDVIVGDVARNNGLVTNDLGVGGVNGNTNMNYTFKTPSLKNIAVRAPFMHDGRFSSLSEVIEHYSSGIEPVPNLDPHFKGPGGEVFQFDFSEGEKSDLLAFLKTLTDVKMLNDVKFSDPFK